MSLNRVSRAEEGNIYRLKNGDCPFKPPFGYKKSPYQAGKIAKISVVPEEARILKEIFERYATGNYGYNELKQYCIEEGVPIRTSMSFVFNNKFYIGIMTYKGIEYPHNYPHMVSKELFEACNRIAKLKKSSNKPMKDPRKKKQPNPIMPYQLKSLEQGLWITTFPFGYKCHVYERRTRGKVYIDEEEKNILLDAFASFSKGGHSLTSLWRYINLKYAPRTFNRYWVHIMLMNKFYIGIMEVNNRAFPHVYPTFIDKEIFDRCQEILSNNNRHRLHIPIAQVKSPKQITLTDQEQAIYDCLSVPLDIEDLSLESNIAPSLLKGILVSMVDRNIIKINEYKEYVRSEHG